MTDGLAAISLDGTATPLFWVEGHAERVALTRGTTTKGRKHTAVEVMRCSECGYLKAYAPEHLCGFSVAATGVLKEIGPEAKGIAEKIANTPRLSAVARSPVRGKQAIFLLVTGGSWGGLQ